MNPSQRHKARTHALQASYEWLLSGNKPSDIEQQLLSNCNLKKMDVNYFRALFQGVVRHTNEIDQHMIPYLDRPITELNPIELCVLRIAIFELDKQLDVPYRVVLNEALNLTKKFGSEDGFKYVNGILDKTAKKLRQTETKEDSQ